MRRHIILLVLLPAGLMSAIAQAQQRTSNPQIQQTQQQDDGRARRVQVRELPVVGNNVLQLIDVLGGLNSGAWWTNAALVTRLGLTEDQKTRIQRAFENHRVNLESSKTQLEKEEAQLGRLLESETIDRGAILLQVDRVTQARSEMERTNSVMTLEMREVLTRAQWMQLPQRSLAVSWTTRNGAGVRGGPAVIATPPLPAGAGQRSGGARGPRGQQ